MEKKKSAGNPTGKSLIASYFVRIRNTKTKKTHICVLCEAKEHARVSLLATEKGKSKFAVGNAEKHFNKWHKEIDHKKPFTGKFRPSLSNSLTVTGMWTKKKAAEEPLTDYAIKKAAYFLCLAEATEEEIELVVHHLQKLCASRLLPYSFVDWPELRELVEVCVALPAKKIAVPHRTSFTEKLNVTYEKIQECLTREVAVAVLTLGEGAFFLQLDGVKTKRGDCEPVLISWIDPATFLRKTITLGIGYDTGKGAANSAANVRSQLQKIGVLDAIDQIIATQTLDIAASRHFKKVFDLSVARLSQRMEVTEARLAALACYMFGSATADGAIKRLLEQVVCRDDVGEGDKTTTHHCSAHCMSLVGRFSFGTKEQQSIFPPDTAARQTLIEFGDLLAGIVDYYADDSVFNQLYDLATKHSQKLPQKMHPPTPTRFNSFIDMCLEIKNNTPIFKDIYDYDPALLPQPVLDFIRERTGMVDNKEVRYTLSSQLLRLHPVLTAVERITSIAEADDTDPFVFEFELDVFMRQLQGDPEAPFKTKQAETGTVTTYEHASLAKGIFTPVVIEALKYSTSYYFERPLKEDWALLLCVILHPCCSGAPASSTEVWPCLSAHFKDFWQKTSSTTWEQQDAKELAPEVMKAGEKVLREELELQYDIDHAAHDLQSAAVAATASNVAAPEAKKPHLSYTSLLKKKNTSTVQETKKQAAVNDQMSFWLTRPGDESLGDPPITMLQFWKGQPDCMLRRVALRAGAFMLSQCATERTNKIPKEIWTTDRMRLSEASMARDVCINTNLDRFPTPTYVWGAKIKESGGGTSTAMVVDEE